MKVLRVLLLFVVVAFISFGCGSSSSNGGGGNLVGTWDFITDEHGDVWDRVDTERKANNRLNKILKNAGL